MVDGDLAVVDELNDPGLGERVEVRAEQQLHVLLLAVAARSAKYTDFVMQRLNKELARIAGYGSDKFMSIF